MAVSRKLIKLVIALTFALSFTLGQVVVASADEGTTTGPNVTNINIDKTDVQAEQTITLTADASDGESIEGLEDFYVVLSHGNDDDGEYVWLDYDGETGKYVGTFTVPKYNSDGTWHISRVFATNEQDADFEATPVAGDPLYKEFNVSGGTVDTEAPKVNNITLNPSTLSAGQEGSNEVYISLDVSDNVSGIANNDWAVSVELANDASHMYSRSIQLSYNPDTHKYEGVYRIPDNATSGVWHVSYVQTEDVARNYLEQDIKPGDPLYQTFTVTNGEDDVTPPVLKSITLDKDTVDNENPSAVHISADASDDKSGISEDSFMVIFEKDVTNDQSSGYQPVNLTYNSQTQRYEGTFDLPAYNSDGKWSITGIHLDDKAGNELDLQPQQGTEFYKSFTVSGSKTDVTDPVINSVSIKDDKDSFSPNDSVEFHVDASDEGSGISTQPGVFSLQLENNSGDNIQQEVDLSYDDQLNLYKGLFNVTPYTKNGLWRITSISASDNANNWIFKSPKLDDPLYKSFTITGASDDDTAPILKGLAIDKTIVKPGAENALHFSMQAEDSGSGISDNSDAVSVFLSNKQTNDYDSVNLTWNSETQQYEGIFTVDEDTDNGTWCIDSVRIADKTGNVYDDSIDPTSSYYKEFKVTHDLTAPNLQVDSISNQTTKVTGTAERGAAIDVSNGSEHWKGTAESDGHFSIDIPKQSNGTQLSVTATDIVGNTSAPVTIVVKDPQQDNTGAHNDQPSSNPPAQPAENNNTPTKTATQNQSPSTQNNDVSQAASTVSPKAVKKAQKTLYTTYAKKKIVLRKSKSTKGKKLATLPKGAAVKVLKKKGKWIQISYKGHKGYILAKSAKNPLFKAVLKNAHLLRSKPSKKAHVIKKIKKKAVVQVLSKSKKWYKVSYSGKVGYIVAKSTKKK